MPSLKSAVLAAAISGATVAANSPNIAIDHSAVRDVAQKITADVAPIIENATNAEPWYRSRVTLGALLAVLSGTLASFGYALPDELRGQILDIAIAAGPVIGGVLALWGRWVAKKPLGT